MIKGYQGGIIRTKISTATEASKAKTVGRQPAAAVILVSVFPKLV